MKKLFTTLIFTLLTLLSFSQTLLYQNNGTFTGWTVGTGGSAIALSVPFYNSGVNFEFAGASGNTLNGDLVRSFSYINDSYFNSPVQYSNIVTLEVGYSTSNSTFINDLKIYTSTDNINWTPAGVNNPITTTNTFSLTLYQNLDTYIKISVVGSILTMGGDNIFTIRYIKLLGTPAATSIEDFTDNNIKIYTYNKQLFIKDIDSDIDGNSKVLIYNISGQIIKETIIKDVIDLSIDNGLYIVVIKDKSGNIIKSKKVYIL